MIEMDDYLYLWLRHRMVLHEIIELLDDSHINFKPWDDAFPLGALVVHIASTTEMFIKSVKNGDITPPTMYQYQTMADVRKIVYDLTEVTKEELKSITVKQLEHVIEYINIKRPGRYWLSNAKDHEIHHKGQLFTYARMVGVQAVPFFLTLPTK
jgi:uncharacterized damage-inducible protein DinB